MTVSITLPAHFDRSIDYMMVPINNRTRISSYHFHRPISDQLLIVPDLIVPFFYYRPIFDLIVPDLIAPFLIIDQPISDLIDPFLRRRKHPL
jgi:hypothetical protein